MTIDDNVPWLVNIIWDISVAMCGFSEALVLTSVRYEHVHMHRISEVQTNRVSTVFGANLSEPHINVLTGRGVCLSENIMSLLPSVLL